MEKSDGSIPKQQLSNNQFNRPQLNTSQIRAPMRQFSQNFSPDNNKRPGIPPSYPHISPTSPYSQVPVSWSTTQQQSGSQNFSPGPSHSRSLSQPAFFSFDSLPPLSRSPYHDSSSNPVSPDVSMKDQDGNSSSQTTLSHPPSSQGNSIRVGESLPPRKGHRRSSSDIPYGFSNVIQSSPSFIPFRGQGIFDQSTSGIESSANKPIELVKRESDWDRNENKNGEEMGERRTEGELVDDLFSAYLNLDNMDMLNSSEVKEKSSHENHEDAKTNGINFSDNEAESSVNESGGTMKREGMKRSAGGDIAPTNRHRRSVSVDSFMGTLPNFGDESLKFPLSPGAQTSQFSPSDSMDGNSAAFSLDSGHGEFSGAELKKIMANEKLTEIAMADPKRAKRILANRQSAARSKERKMRYISELEHKVQTLQTEATTLSAQVTLLQRDSTGLTNENNELKLRLQSMEQQAQLQDAINEALTAEVQRLKLISAEMGGEVHLSNCLAQQLSMKPLMFQLQHKQQPTQLNIYQLQQQQQQQRNQSASPPPQPSQQQQNNNKVTKHNPNQ